MKHVSVAVDINTGGWKLPGIESQNSWVLYLGPCWLLGFGISAFLTLSALLVMR